MAILVSSDGTSVQVVLRAYGPTTAPNELVLGDRPAYGTTLFVSRAERADIGLWFGRQARQAGDGEYFNGHLVRLYEPVSSVVRAEVIASAVAELAAIAMTIRPSDLDLCGVNVHNTVYRRGA